VLDRELPGRGWPLGALVEILVDEAGSGELALLLPHLVERGAQGGIILWVAPPYLPYAPAFAAAGVPSDRLVVLRPRSEEDALWTAEQTLRSAFSGSLLVWLARAGYAAMRRLAVSAEGGFGSTFVFRPRWHAGQPSPAALRLALDGYAAGGLSLRLLKRRGAPLPHPLHLPLPGSFRALDRSPFPEVALAGERAAGCRA